MPTQSPSERHPPGLLRLLVLFHEVESLGASTTVMALLPDLEQFGWTPSAWFPGQGPLNALSDRFAKSFGEERPLAFSRTGWREPPGLLARAIRAPRYVRRLRETLAYVRPHVVHANTLLALPEALVARSCGLPVVLHVHEIPAEGAKRAAAIRVASEAADVLVAVSDAVAQMLRRGAGGTPVITVRNGTPLAPAPARRSEGQLTVGTVGTVSRTKGTDTFLRAAHAALAQRPALRFEHVGAGHLHRDPRFSDELRVLLDEGAGDERITMLGARPASTVVPGWDVFVLASRSEGFPLATLEAMALGLPVVATTVGGMPEQIEHLRTGILVRPDDYEALATWIVRLHDDEGLRRRLGAAAAEHVRKTFTIASQAEGMHRAYLIALNRRFGPPSVRRVLPAT